MVSSSSILHTLLLTWTTSQNDTGYSDPPPSSNPSALVFPIAARWNTTKAFNSGQRGASRASFLRGKHHSRHQTSSARALISDPIEDDTIVYVASVMIGSLGTIYNLIVDTTSGNTWVGAGKPFLTTSTSRSAGSNVRVEYANKVFEGVELLDRVEIANIAMPNKSIGVFQTTNTGLGGIPGVDGILGIGPEELSVGTLEINATLGVPTIVQTLSCQRNITAQLFAIALQPTTGVMSLNGEISWGAVDTTKFTGPVVFSPIASQEPSSSFWSTNMTFSYGATSLFAGSAPGIIDTGSTLIYLATDAYSRYLMLTGATLDPATNFLTVPSINNLQTLVFTMNGTQFSFTPNAQIWPRSLNTAIGGQCCKIYLVIADLGTASGVGLDFILGITFLQRFYSVYDYTNALFGLAVTPFTNATSN